MPVDGHRSVGPLIAARGAEMTERRDNGEEQSDAGTRSESRRIEPRASPPGLSASKLCLSTTFPSCPPSQPPLLLVTRP